MIVHKDISLVIKVKGFGFRKIKKRNSFRFNHNTKNKKTDMIKSIYSHTLLYNSSGKNLLLLYPLACNSYRLVIFLLPISEI